MKRKKPYSLVIYKTKLAYPIKSQTRMETIDQSRMRFKTNSLETLPNHTRMPKVKTKLAWTRKYETRKA